MPDDDYPADRPARRPSGCGQLLLAALVGAVVSAVITVALNYILVPGGVGWRKMTQEGTVTVPGGQPWTVWYPSTFTKAPSLSLEAQGNDVWFYQINEATSDHFTITNTTVQKGTGTPVLLTLKWKAEGARW